MRLYPHRIHRMVQKLAPGLMWHVETTEKEVYFTFDDGPHPEITPWVMDQLEAYNGKGTFFMVGDNAVKYPEVVQQVLDRGHAIGNHTHHHIKGWNTGVEAYVADVQKAQAHLPTALFRPPYGRITPAQVRALKPHFTIVMWEVLTGDFDRYITAVDCTRAVVKHTRPGSLVVYHDSEKSFPRLRESLPAALQALQAKGYSFKAL